MSTRSRGAVLYRAPRMRYPLAVAASGMRITDSSGKRYLDMSGGAAVSCLGHGDPDVIAAIHAQLQQLAYAHTSFFTNEPQEQLAEAIARRFGDPGARVYFLCSGSEANETAFKMAWQYWVAKGSPTKKTIISREHSYHGNTFGALSVSGNDIRRRASAAPLIDWPRIPPCYPYRERRAGENLESYSARSAALLQDAIDKCGAENVAAFICEPVVGSSLGVVAATPGYLQRIRDICDSNDILLIADEIMCGSGRTGSYFAHQFDGIRPDIVTIAKGIGGGYQPLAAAVIASRVAAVLTETGFAHGHTYIGHATACAAGVAVQRVLDRDDLLQRTLEMGERFLSLLRDAFADHPHVGEVRGRGLFMGIELVDDVVTRAGFADRRSLPEELRRLAMDHGLICYPGGILVDDKLVPHIMLAPPMIAEDRHLLECVDKLIATLDSAFKM